MAQANVSRSRDIGWNLGLSQCNQKPTQMKTYLLKNWKTSLVGVFAILAVVTSTWLPQYRDELEAVVGVLAGLGLLAAKDSDKDGV